MTADGSCHFEIRSEGEGSGGHGEGADGDVVGGGAIGDRFFGLLLVWDVNADILVLLGHRCLGIHDELVVLVLGLAFAGGAVVVQASSKFPGLAGIGFGGGNDGEEGDGSESLHGLNLVIY